jgi:hypothetical protein
LFPELLVVGKSYWFYGPIAGSLRCVDNNLFVNIEIFSDFFKQTEDWEWFSWCEDVFAQAVTDGTASLISVEEVEVAPIDLVTLEYHGYIYKLAV